MNQRTVQQPFLVVLPVDGARSRAVKDEVASVDEALRGALQSLEGLHFFSIQVVHPSEAGARAHLLFDITFDGGHQGACEALDRPAVAALLRRILSAAGLDVSASLRRFLASHVVRLGTLR